MYHSEFRDDETEWQNYGYRYFASEIGRWLGRDPIELDSYTMLGNNPVNFVDSYGLCAKGTYEETELKTTARQYGVDQNTKAALDAAKKASKELEKLIKRSRLGYVEPAAIGASELLISIGYPITVEISITYKCCNCDKVEGATYWSGETTETEEVPSPVADFWSLKTSDQGTPLAQAILDAYSSLRTRLQTRCGAGCDEN